MLRKQATKTASPPVRTDRIRCLAAIATLALSVGVPARAEPIAREGIFTLPDFRARAAAFREALGAFARPESSI